ncbi:MarR family transcriptional regulator [Bacillus mycoides]
MKETFSLFEKINMALLEEYHSLLEFDLTPKQYAIVELVYHEKKITINEIANKLSLSSSSVSQLINKLEKEAYVKREINPNHRREIFVKLERKGHELFKAYEQVDRQVIKKYYSKLTFEEVVQFRDIAKKLYGIIAEDKNLKR